MTNEATIGSRQKWIYSLLFDKMNSLIPFILSAIIPGTGQLYMGRYTSGLLNLLLPILLIFLLPYFALFIYPTFAIISFIEIYQVVSKSEGKKKAMIQLNFGLITVIIIIPTLIFLFQLSVINGNQYVRKQYLNEGFTRDEMQEIQEALKWYKNNTDTFPDSFSSFVQSKPIWQGWLNDAWNQNYKYERTDSSYTLTSAGKDGLFGTEDDIIVYDKSD